MMKTVNKRYHAESASYVDLTDIYVLLDGKGA